MDNYIILGVDPGNPCGIAVVSKDKIYTKSFSATYDALQYVKTIEEPIIIVLEAVYIDSINFVPYKQFKYICSINRSLPTDQKYRKAVNYISKRSKNNGSVASSALIWKQFADYHKIRVVEVAPSKRVNVAKGKYSKIYKNCTDKKMLLDLGHPTKLSREQCEIMYEYNGATNSHMRDALSLAYWWKRIEK